MRAHRRILRRPTFLTVTSLTCTCFHSTSHARRRHDAAGGDLTIAAFALRLRPTGIIIILTFLGVDGHDLTVEEKKLRLGLISICKFLTYSWERVSDRDSQQSQELAPLERPCRNCVVGRLELEEPRSGFRACLWRTGGQRIHRARRAYGHGCTFCTPLFAGA